MPCSLYCFPVPSHEAWRDQQAYVACALNGLGLALVIPCIQSMCADYSPAEQRGRAFGTLFCVGAVGAPLTNAPRDRKGLLP